MKSKWASSTIKVVLLFSVFSLMIPGYAIPSAFAPSCITPPSGLISWWPLNEAPGTGTSIDIIGALAGTWNGDPTAFAGKVNNALAFDGDDHVTISNDPSLEPASTITVDAWLRADSSPGHTYIVSKGAFGGSSPSYTLYAPDGDLGFLVRTTVGTPAWAVSPIVPAATAWDGEWHHVVGTYDGSDIRLYFDGVEVGDGTAKTGNILYGSADPKDLTIGTYAILAFTNLFFTGDVDEVEIFDRVLSQPEIQDIFEAGSAGKCIIGCSSGFYKNDAQKFGATQWTTILPSDDFEFLFGPIDDLKGKGANKNIALPDMLEALNTRGSGHNALAREAVSALLNSQVGSGVDYALSEAQVIALVSDALSGSAQDIEDVRASLFALNHGACPLLHGPKV